MTEDHDLDSSMLSSPSNEEEDHDSEQNLFDQDDNQTQNLFPSSDRPSTPQNSYLNTTAPDELSPPQSQPASQRTLSGLPEDPLDMHGVGSAGNGDTSFTNPHRGTARDTTEATGGVSGRAPPQQQEGQAGKEAYAADARWKTKKSQEEYFRILETVADKDFSLREYGDLFDERALVQEQR